jgi:hypothetical protein
MEHTGDPFATPHYGFILGFKGDSVISLHFAQHDLLARTPALCCALL